MSYDLFFRVPVGHNKPSPIEIGTYFSKRPHYSVNGNECGYENEDTGVYFSFQWNPRDPDDRDEEDGPPPDASFNINYSRPSFFGLEAASELKAFANAFGFVVDDPQMDGMGENAEFTAEGFLSGWDTGNLFGIQVAVGEVGAVPGPASLPGEKLQAIWRWNLNRNRRQEELGKDIFVPKISPLFQAGTILTTAVWTDAIPIELPEVDVVLIVLDEYKGMFERTGSVRSMPFDELRPSLDEFTGSHEPVKHWHLGYTRPPKALIRLVRKARKVSGRFAMVSWDRVLDAELLAKAHNKT